MSTNPNDGWSSGRSENAARSVSAVITDCSNWESDIPTEGWSTGRSENAVISRAAIEVDCSGWDKQPAAWLELVVSFEAATPPVRVIEQTNRLIAAAVHAAPDLGLTYDVTRSRTENDDVVISLAPRNPAGAAERLAAVTEVIRRATEAVPAPQPITVRVGKAA